MERILDRSSLLKASRWQAVERQHSYHCALRFERDGQGGAQRAEFCGIVQIPGSTEGFPLMIDFAFSATQPESPMPSGISREPNRR